MYTNYTMYQPNAQGAKVLCLSQRSTKRIEKATVNISLRRSRTSLLQ